MHRTKEQVRLESIATAFLKGGPHAYTVYVRPQDSGVGLAIAFEACGHTFIARGRLMPFSSTATIYFECCRLLRAFRRLWMNTTGQVGDDGPDDRCVGRWAPTFYT